MMPISSLSPFQATPQTGQPNATDIRAKKRSAIQNQQPAAAIDSLQFSGKPQQAIRMGNNSKVTTGERFKGAWKAVKNSITSFSWWGKQTAIAAAITLATCWLPGSQLVTIPLWLGIDLTMKAVDGLFHPKKYNAPPPKTTPQPEQSQNFSNRIRGKGALKGFGSGMVHGIKDDFKKKALIGGALCLATCWLPGSQLLLIPALFCTYGACGGIQHGIKGWNHPDQYLDSLKQSREAQAQ